jgi:hypothetical protein
VKPNNVVVEYRVGAEGQTYIERVNLADTDNAAKVLHGTHITGIQVGNVMWRRPKAQAGIHIGKKSDVFSFGMLVSAPYKLREVWIGGPALIGRFFAVHLRRTEIWFR